MLSVSSAGARGQGLRSDWPPPSGEGYNRIAVRIAAVLVQPGFDGWGSVHLFRNGSGKLTEPDTFAVEQAMDPALAKGFGDLSVHEPATSHVDDTLVSFS